MLGAFKQSSIAFGGLLWKSPWRMSNTRKMRARLRLKGVDDIVATLQSSGINCLALEKALSLPTEQQMNPKDKYTVFSRTDPGYRKSLHKVPKWTRLTLRENAFGF